MNATTDLTIEGIRKSAREQLGQTDKPQLFIRGNTHIITLTVGQWAVVERILDFAEKMKEINADVAK